jgi:hypothetical protein
MERNKKSIISKSVKFTNTCQLNNIALNNQGINYELLYCEMNLNEDKTY